MVPCKRMKMGDLCPGEISTTKGLRPVPRGPRYENVTSPLPMPDIARVDALVLCVPQAQQPDPQEAV